MNSAFFEGSSSSSFCLWVLLLAMSEFYADILLMWLMVAFTISDGWILMDIFDGIILDLNI